MKTFKIGDSVRLKRGLKDNNSYDDIILLSEMRFKGVRQIKEIPFEDMNIARIDINDYTYGYSFAMLTKIESK